MYFETIHDLSDFEEVRGPTEDGYSSCWETETEFDSELGNFIFHNVTGDSASVICIDEAMDLLAMRDQQQQQMQMQMEETRRKVMNENAVGDDLTKLGPGDLEEYTFDREGDDKRGGGASRHSHHSGSDGTYDGPQQATIHATHIVATPVPPDEPDCEDHIYETLDACQEHQFQVYFSKGAPAPELVQCPVPTVPARPPSHHSSDSGSDKGSRSKNRVKKSSSFKSTFGKSQTPPLGSLEQPAALPRRGRPSLRKKTSLDSNERGTQVAPKQYPAPIKGYGAEKPPSPSKRSPQNPLSPPAGINSTAHNSPSLIIKHKGKTYVIPVVEKKKEVKSKQSSSSTKRVHNVLCTTTNAVPTSITNTPLPPIPVTNPQFVNGYPSAHAPPLPHKRQANQAAAAPEYYDTSRRRKVLQQTNGSLAPSSKHSAASNKVTHYGML